ncbi:MAG: enoyl-CoA hydratase-related protein [Gemmatimonadota bacterium]
MSQDTPSAIRLDLGDRIARITLDRPERHNALEAVDVHALLEAFEAVDASEARALLLSGSGNETFSSGASLDQMESGHMSRALFSTVTDRLIDVRIPTVCAIRGRIYGGGGEIALCCDFRVGSRDTALLVPAAKLGLAYPESGLRRYVERLGHGAAARVFLAAETIDGTELHRLGYLTHFVGPDEVRGTADELCQRLANLAPLALRSMKRTLSGLSSANLDAEEAAASARLCDESEDLAEGLAAWRERRPPVFRGR